MYAQMINFKNTYCELEREVEDEIRQVNKLKDHMVETLMENYENEMSQQEATCLVYFDTKYIF